ncbi:MAG TPA: HD domain-containing phosphohydrolase, partial [Burkholderiales bacterium]|nr:HD domain-containing phosphohydrolase [Burkholderiales bacterium]
GHALQIGVLLVSFGRELGFARAELAQLGQIGLLFDIGKLRVSPALLNKQGSLTSEEFDAVKLHVQYSLEMIGDSASVNEAVMKGVAQHHERLNGSGYPKRLRGTQIETFGRMAGIVDCFAAMTSLRPYADPLSAYDAMRLLQKWADTYFNAGLIQQFIQAIGIFPVGTLVELSTGEAAVIIEQHRAHRLKPKVLVITDTNGAALKVPIILDLLYGTGAYADSLPHIRRGLPAEAVGAASAEFYLSHL